jgi:hypothetical protein
MILFAALSTPPPGSSASSGGLSDLAAPVPVPLPAWVWPVVWSVAVLLLALLIWFIWRWIKSRPAPAPPTPRSVALRALEKLRPQVHTTDPYAFSIEVSDVLRTYIGAAFGLYATQQTSPEFLAAISQSPKFSDGDRQLLGEFLERCDLIKFARIDATTADSARLLESAMAFARGGGA